ncbi:MAG: nitroreductase family protein [Candidatus Omnitrophota bacterium]
MNFLELVHKRQSCRKYSDRTVDRQAIERCLEAARLSPSACNSQPWRFIVISDPELKTRVCGRAFHSIYAMNNFSSQAPVLVAVVRESSRYAARLGGTMRNIQYSLIDLGSAVEHFILQAAEEGLGTCWLGWFDERAVKKELGLKRGDRLDIMVSVGYPERGDIRKKDRKALSEIIERR